MSDKINKKVIDIFSKHKKQICNNGEVCEAPNGYKYVSIETDDNGRHFTEEALLKKAEESYYIVKVMVKKGINPIINNFKVPGAKIIDFVNSYSNTGIEGRIIEIDKFYPEEWA